MPYITQEARARLAGDPVPKTPGELNYLITLRIIREVEERGKSYATFNDIGANMVSAQQLILSGEDALVEYDGFLRDVLDICGSYVWQRRGFFGDERFGMPEGIEGRSLSVIGALEFALSEFKRRVVAPYEDGKIAENGDVYGAIL